jgi:hypothetical protein
MKVVKIRGRLYRVAEENPSRQAAFYRLARAYVKRGAGTFAEFKKDVHDVKRIPADVLAHKLDISWEAARYVQWLIKRP